jgi:hypothetical protein
MLARLGRESRGVCMCICCAVGGGCLVIRARMRRVEMSPLPGGEEGIRDAFLFAEGGKMYEKASGPDFPTDQDVASE